MPSGVDLVVYEQKQGVVVENYANPLAKESGDDANQHKLIKPATKLASTRFEPEEADDTRSDAESDPEIEEDIAAEDDEEKEEISPFKGRNAQKTKL